MIFKSLMHDAEIHTLNIDQRKAERFSSIAQVTVDGFSGYAVLNDMSPTGFSITSKTYVALIPQEHYMMCIIPEPQANLESFELEVEVRWVQSEETTFHAGLAIVYAPNESIVQHYIDYLKLHGKRMHDSLKS
ncbi:MAG: PilZ domain-containing protein [Treponema sp.]|jgi:hypothetical protein|nr:PilZ domain-containing protein [Treponema sp.]